MEKTGRRAKKTKSGKFCFIEKVTGGQFFEYVEDFLPRAKKRVFLSVFAFLKEHSQSYGTEKGGKWRKMNHFGLGKETFNIFLIPKNAALQGEGQ